VDFRSIVFPAEDFSIRPLRLDPPRHRVLSPNHMRSRRGGLRLRLGQLHSALDPNRGQDRRSRRYARSGDIRIASGRRFILSPVRKHVRNRAFNPISGRGPGQV